ncbi:Anthocyanidin 3-O-glucosyltransferase 2 [Vitis vinifera]|uniref:Glycosyltransferase n=1 Tax=Vitis vinifera TaxID=29760 RepID=A0A438I267_VITVI|nr:Anthocyanidin 3-O-glucosyltransferase 2 [Vitis vinifera]
MGKHIGVLAFPFASHPLTILGLVRRLASAAPDAKFSFFSTANSNSFLFSARSPGGVLGNLKPYDVPDGVPVGHVLSGNPAEGDGLFLKEAPANFKRAMEVAVAETGRKISCLVTDALLWFAADMAEEMGVPWVPFWIAGLSALSAHLHTDVIRQMMGVRGERNLGFFVKVFYETFMLVLQTDTSSVVKDLFMTVRNDLPRLTWRNSFRELGFYPSLMLHKMGLTLPRATAIVANSFEELDPVVATHLKSKLPKLLCVAPSALTSSPDELNSDVNGCLSWLDKQKAKSVAYISFGSMLAPSPDEHVALAETLQATGVAFLWSIKDNLKKYLPEGFLERTSGNGKVVPWAPQIRVLAHPSVGVHITHGGWNSVMESIAGEVPMICRPFWADNTLNSRAIEDVWGIGVGVPGGVLTKNGLKVALEQVLGQQGRMTEKIGVLKKLWTRPLSQMGAQLRISVLCRR